MILRSPFFSGGGGGVEEVVKNSGIISSCGHHTPREPFISTFLSIETGLPVNISNIILSNNFDVRLTSHDKAKSRYVK